VTAVVNLTESDKSVGIFWNENKFWEANGPAMIRHQTGVGMFLITPLNRNRRQRLALQQIPAQRLFTS
jgi:hypothetical protein